MAKKGKKNWKAETIRLLKARLEEVNKKLEKYKDAQNELSTLEDVIFDLEDLGSERD